MGASAIVLTMVEGQERGHYTFVCPVCEGSVQKPADRKVVLLLMSAGVAIHEPERPRELVSAVGTRPEGPPLTHDDLIDFHFLLQQDDWFDRLLTSAE